MSGRLFTGHEAKELVKGTTPGPWNTSRNHSNEGWCFLVANDHYEVARVIDGQGSEETHDAALIAAAPDLAATVSVLSDAADASAERNANLRAENQRLRTEVEHLNSVYAASSAHVEEMVEALSESRAENQRLRDGIDGAVNALYRLVQAQQRFLSANGSDTARGAANAYEHAARIIRDETTVKP